MKVKSKSEVTQKYPSLHHPMDCSPPGSSVHGILQARVLEWVAIAFSKARGYSSLNHPGRSPGTDMLLVIEGLCLKVYKVLQDCRDGWKENFDKCSPIWRSHKEREILVNIHSRMYNFSFECLNTYLIILLYITTTITTHKEIPFSILFVLKCQVLIYQLNLR